MKTILGLSLGFTTLAAAWHLGAQPGLPTRPDFEQAGWQLLQAGPDSRTWGRPGSWTNATGTAVLQTNLLVELSTGLNRRGEGSAQNAWVESAPQLVVTNDGVVGLGARHTAHFAANLNTRAAIQVRLPDGAGGSQWVKCDLVGIAYEDPVSGTNLLIASVKNCAAQVVGSDRVVYVDAFDGVRANVVLRYTAAGVSQEILFLEQIPGPATFGLSPDTAQLVAITEVIDGPAPQVQERAWQSQGRTVRD